MADHDALKALHTALIDSRNGLDEALKDANDPTIKPILQKVRDLHNDAHADVHVMLKSEGEEPEDSGSLMTTLHETIVSVRSTIGALGKSSLSAFATGEERNLVKFDEAIAEKPSAAEALGKHRSQLAAAIDEMKAMSA